MYVSDAKKAAIHSLLARVAVKMEIRNSEVLDLPGCHNRN